ncbi:MAG: DUF1559 domain-containing protein, partial [Chloroflexota bacterium]|nr:DUF1559 domain-containing protein [Chloroflexota bacterium]
DWNRSDITGQKDIRMNVIATYVCPSDNHPPTFQIPLAEAAGIGPNRVVALHNYAASAGPSNLAKNSKCYCAQDWNSFSSGTYWERNNWPGPFNRLGIPCALNEIRDGLSNTIFFGEVRPLCSMHAERGWEDSCNGSGYHSTIIPINFDTCTRDSTDNCSRHCNWHTSAGFKSAHTGGAQFLFGDGAVRMIPETIDHWLYQYLGAKADGEIVSKEF